VPGRHHVCGSLFVHETLVDLVLDIVDLQVCMKTKAVRQSRRLRKLRKIESELETVARMADAVSGLPEKVKTRVSRLRDLLSLVKTASGSDDVNTVCLPYEKAAAVWRSGVRRHDRVGVDVKHRTDRTVLGELPQQVYVVTEIQFDSGSETFGVDYDGVVSRGEGWSEEEDDDEQEEGCSQCGRQCDCGECGECDEEEDSEEEVVVDDDDDDDDGGHYDGNDYPMSNDACKYW
jgi:hypothetical protein